MNTEAMRATLRVTKALADPQRLRILMMLEPGELCVCQIVEVLGLAPSTVSKHLSILAAADLVMVRRDGRWAYYHLPNPATADVSQPVLDWLSATLRDDGQIQADREKLAAVTSCEPGDLCRRQRGDSGALGDRALPAATPDPVRGVLGEPALPDAAPHPIPGGNVGETQVGRDLRARRSLPQRRKLPHAVPGWVPQSARFFITINCKQKGLNTLCHDRVAQALLMSARHYEETGRWYLWLVLIMPDHVHIIASFGPDHGLRAVVGQWKRYQARHQGIKWQANFFDHRLRSDDEFLEKAHYIRMNPVRKELVANQEAWQFVLDRTGGVLGEPALP